MAHILPFVFLIFVAPVHEAASLPQQTCDFHNWCSAGSYCDDTSTSRCAPCPPRTYQPPVQYTVYRCIPHSVCFVSPLDHDINDGRTGVLREGNRTQDTVCECEDGKYWNEMERGCRQITKCKAGEGVSNIAVAMYDTKCTACHPGTYSDQLSATQVCRVCTDCRALQRTTLEPCTPGQDAVCGAILIPATGPGDLQETSRPKDNSRSVPTADSQEPQNNSPVTTTEAIGGKSPRPVELLHQTQIAMIAGTTVTVVVLLMVAVAVTIFCFCKKRRRKAASSRQARPDPEGGSQLEHLMTVPNNTGQESDAGEEEEDEEEETDPKEAVSAAGHPVQDTNDPKDNERDLFLKETNDGLEEIPGSRPEGAEGTTSLKDARSPVQDTEDPEGNERDLNTKDATYGLQELTEGGDVTVTTSLREAEEDQYKETPV